MPNKAWPELTFPQAEADILRDTYSRANIILEYGSGGSTLLAASMPDKLIFSVESDAGWALSLQSIIDSSNLPSPATLYYANIGQTGEWGRPMDNRYWPFFYKYPLDIWDEPFFRDPDVALIDGRFRAACMMTVLAKTTKNITILFDDYVDRKPYHIVEEFIAPATIIGRLAVFHVEPGLISKPCIKNFNQALSQATYASLNTHYGSDADAAIKLRNNI